MIVFNRFWLHVSSQSHYLRCYTTSLQLVSPLIFSYGYGMGVRCCMPSQMWGAVHISLARQGTEVVAIPYSGAWLTWGIDLVAEAWWLAWEQGVGLEANIHDLAWIREEGLACKAGVHNRLAWGRCEKDIGAKTRVALEIGIRGKAHEAHAHMRD